MDNFLSMESEISYTFKGDETKYNVHTVDIRTHASVRARWETISLGMYENLQFFKNYKKPKLMVCYEMLVHGGWEYTLQEIAKAVGGPNDLYIQCREDFEKYRLDSCSTPFRPPMSLPGQDNSHKDGKHKSAIKGALSHRIKLKSRRPDNYNLLGEIMAPILEDPLVEKLYKSIISENDLGHTASAH